MKQPGFVRMAFRGITRACPICGRRKLFTGIKLVEDCPQCGLHFERIEGHWIGAVGINTIATFATIGIIAAGGLIATYPDFASRRLIVLGIAVSILFPIAFHPSSRMLWTAIDLTMRPLEPHEATNTEANNTEAND